MELQYILIMPTSILIVKDVVKECTCLARTNVLGGGHRPYLGPAPQTDHTQVSMKLRRIRENGLLTNHGPSSQVKPLKKTDYLMVVRTPSSSNNLHLRA